MTPRKDLFGQIACEKGLLSPEKLEEVLRLQKESAPDGRRKRIGEICIELGYMTAEQMEDILYEQAMKYIASQHPEAFDDEESFLEPGDRPSRQQMQAPQKAAGVQAAQTATHHAQGPLPPKTSAPASNIPKPSARPAGARHAPGGSAKAKQQASPKGHGCLSRVLLAALAAAAAGILTALST
jgi:hypothetical protein